MELRRTPSGAAAAPHGSCPCLIHNIWIINNTGSHRGYITVFMQKQIHDTTIRFAGSVDTKTVWVHMIRVERQAFLLIQRLRSEWCYEQVRRGYYLNIATLKSSVLWRKVGLDPEICHCSLRQRMFPATVSRVSLKTLTASAGELTLSRSGFFLLHLKTPFVLFCSNPLNNLSGTHCCFLWHFFFLLLLWLFWTILIVWLQQFELRNQHE